MNGHSCERPLSASTGVRYLTGRSNDWMKNLREAGDAGGPPRTRRQVEMRQACPPVGQVAPVAPATYRGFMKR
jgi:hypothetical protein